MKARKVKHLDADAALADELERIIRVRVDELCSFMPRAADPDEVDTLHDLRIAAKRLRYLLEVGAPCFGPYAADAAKRAKHVQDLVGEIHDCDVLLPEIRALQRAAAREDAATVAAAAPPDAQDLDPALSAAAPNAAVHRGLQTLATHLRARRVLLFARFTELWTELEREGFRARLEFAITERPAFTSISQDGDESAADVDLPSQAI